MIKLIKSYPYDNSYDYIKLFSTKIEQTKFFNSFESIIIENDDGYTIEGRSLIIDYNYDYLVNEGVNYVIWNNGYKDLYCFILSKEYVNDEITRIYYEIDVINTYLFDFSIKKSFIERKKCSLEEITDYDEGIEIGEHIIESETEVLNKNYTLFAMFSGFKDYYVSKEQTDFKEMQLIDNSRKGTVIDGVRYPLSFFALDTEHNINSFYTYLIDHPSLEGVIALPNCNYSTDNFFIPFVKMENGNIIKSGMGVQNFVTSITSNDITGGGVTVNKNNITDFFPYTYYVLTDGESEPLIMHPQYCGDSINIKGKFALSHSPVERYYPTYYKGDTSGRIYNISNTSVMLLPIAKNGGLETLTSSASYFEQSKKSLMSNVLVSTVGAVAGAVTGGIGVGVAVGLTSIVNSNINTIKENMARYNDLELTPSSIKSYGTPSTRSKFNTNNVRLIKYTIKDKYKNRINNYVERYGNKYNNYDIIDLKLYKGFVKFIAPDIDSKIDNQYINKIKNILERGLCVE